MKSSVQEAFRLEKNKFLQNWPSYSQKYSEKKNCLCNGGASSNLHASTCGI